VLEVGIKPRLTHEGWQNPSPNTVHLARILTWARAKHLGVRVAAATAFHSCESRMNLGRKAVAAATRTPRCFARN